MFWRDLKSTNWTNVPRKVSQEIPWSNGLKAVLIRTLAKRFGLIYIGAGELLREAGVGGPSDTEWRLSSFHQSLMEAWPIGVGNSIKSEACSMHVTDARSWSWLQILWFWFSPHSPLLIHSAGWSAISGLFIVYMGLHDTHVQHSLLKALGMGILYTSVTMSVCYLKKTSD